MKVEYKSVADLGDIVTGKTPSTGKAEYWDGDIPFITPTDIVGYDMRYIFDTERKVSNAAAVTQKKTIVPPNSICVSCIASIGKMCITFAERSITNQQINTIIVKNGYDYRYVFYLLRHFLPYIQLIAGGTGAGTPIISKNKFARLKYPVCVDFRLQKQIADILSTYDSLIELNNKRIKVLEQMAKNLHKEWFGRFRFPGHETAEFENGIPKGWTVCKLKDKFHIVLGGTPSREEKSYWNGKIPWINSGAVNNARILEASEYITEKGYAHSATKMMPVHTTVLAITGATLGQVSLTEIEVCGNQSVVGIFGDSTVVSYYLFGTIQNNICGLTSRASGGAQQSINKEDVKNFKILLPNDETLLKYNACIEPIFQKIAILHFENINLTKQRDLLRPRLMSGKLEVV